jgi:hypothetical protein
MSKPRDINETRVLDLATVLPGQPDINETRVIDIDAVLQYVRQLKADTVDLIFSLQRERDAKTELE